MRYSTRLLPALGLVCSVPIFGQQSPFYDPPLELRQSAIHQGVSFPAVVTLAQYQLMGFADPARYND